MLNQRLVRAGQHPASRSSDDLVAIERENGRSRPNPRMNPALGTTGQRDYRTTDFCRGLGVRSSEFGVRTSDFSASSYLRSTGHRTTGHWPCSLVVLLSRGHVVALIARVLGFGGIGDHRNLVTLADRFDPLQISALTVKIGW